MKNIQPEVNWSIKDIIFIVVTALIFVCVLSFLFLEKMKENPFLGAFFVDILIIILVAVLLRRLNNKWEILGFVRKDSGKAIIKGFFIGAIIFFVTKLIFYPTSYQNLFSNEITLVKIVQCFLLLITFRGFVHICLTPFVEEVISRGLLFQVLLSRFSSATSIVLVATFDTLLHANSWQNYKWLLIRLIYFISITVLFKKYRNLFLCISTHATLNYFATLVSFLTK